MAKALFGHTAATVDPRLVAEVRSLRTRVRDLETELERSRTENAVLAAALEVVDGTDTSDTDEISRRAAELASSPEPSLLLPEPAYS